MPRGTEVVLHLKEDAKHYLETHDIERIVRTYSDHILFPIELAAARTARRIRSMPRAPSGSGRNRSSSRRTTPRPTARSRARSTSRP